ncbi:hypothetical protein HZA86_03410 [Candidatus Uhrbacteria bacterium]|nr:hypothetical protein [Candidatus Uhrbacteria bacterium]
MFPYQSLNAGEHRLFLRLASPSRIQDALNRTPFNYEKEGETCRSPRRVIRDRVAHCLEGALFAAAALWYHGRPPLLLDLKTTTDDDEHVVALFRRGRYWGAISKTTHAVLRYRDPVYASVRELAMSYFHEYHLPSGKKTMRAFSEAFDLRYIQQQDWIVSEDDLWDISDALDHSPHQKILSRSMIAMLRRVEPIERKAAKIVQV